MVIRSAHPQQVSTGQITYDLRRLRVHDLSTTASCPPAWPTGLAHLDSPTDHKLRRAHTAYQDALDDLARRDGIAA